MKKLVISFALLTASLANAGTFKVKNPAETTQHIPIPINNLSCTLGPFGSSQLQVILPQPVGSLNQKGILETNSMGMVGNECNDIIMNLLKFANNGIVELEARILNRSIVRLASADSYTCEGAQQEVVSMNVGGTAARESIYKSEESLDCPVGIYPYHVNSRDHVIYVLHEDGIPTKSEF